MKKQYNNLKPRLGTYYGIPITDEIQKLLSQFMELDSFVSKKTGVNWAIVVEAIRSSGAIIKLRIDGLDPKTVSIELKPYLKGHKIKDVKVSQRISKKMWLTNLKTKKAKIHYVIPTEGKMQPLLLSS